MAGRAGEPPVAPPEVARSVKARAWAVAFSLVAALALAAPAGAADDPALPDQWALSKIKAEKAWATSGGAGTVIAIVDTGIDFAHEDLAGKEAGSYSCIGGSCKPHQGDDHGHGTIVAGVAGAVTGNGRGIASVAPGAKLLSVKVLGSSGSGSLRDVSRGIVWAVDRGAHVINLSLGGPIHVFVTDTASQSGFVDAVNYAWSRGRIVVASAGNSAEVISTYAGAPNLYVVGATGPSDEIASYSSGSVDVDVFAPGGDGDCTPATCIISTGRGNVYVMAKGTSLAAPHVAGVAAQLVCLGLSNQAAIGRMNNTADPIAGGRRVNAAAAVGSPVGSGCAASFPTESVAAGSPVIPSEPRPQAPRPRVTSTAAPPTATAPGQETLEIEEAPLSDFPSQTEIPRGVTAPSAISSEQAPPKGGISGVLIGLLYAFSVGALAGAAALIRLRFSRRS